jgi:hypothetical protein
MPDTFTELTSESLGGRLIESIKGILVGVVFVLIAIGLLFWNEGRAVQTADMLSEGAASVVSVAADKVVSSNEGRLVHVSGDVTTSEQLADPQFGMSAHALQLRRGVEAYQWVESSQTTTEKKLGGGEEHKTTYTYDKKWSDKLVNSTDFKVPAGHVNPSGLRFKGERWVAKHAKLGAFALPERIVGKLANFEALPASADKLPPELKGGAAIQDGEIYFAADPKLPFNAQAPSVGDTRVKFDVVNPEAASIVAKQLGETFEPYGTKNGEDLELVQAGTASAAAMFKQAAEANATLSWILRAVGLFACCLGIFLVLRPLAVVADVIPFFGSLVSFGAGLAALVVGATLSLVTVALSWIGHRPVLGCALLVAAAGVLFGGKLLAGNKKKLQGAAQPA